MAETDPQKTEGAGASDGTENTGESQQNDRVPYDRFKQVNDAKNAAEAELQNYRNAEAARKLKEQQEAGKFQEVIDTLRPKAERVDTLEKTLKGYLDAEVAEIPEDMRSLVPAGDVTTQLEWVKKAKAAGVFKKPTASPLDGGRQGDGGGGQTAVKLTPEQKAAAARAGMTEEQFIKAFAVTSKKPE